MGILDEIEYQAYSRPGAWDTGGSRKWIPADPVSFPFRGGRPQPLGSEIIEMLDEAARTRMRGIVYVDDDQPELRTIKHGEPGYESDLVMYKGKAHEVTSVDDWSDMPLGYRAYILLKYAPDERAPV